MLIIIVEILRKVKGIIVVFDTSSINNSYKKKKLTSLLGEYSSEAVDYYKRLKGVKNIDLAMQLGVSESYIKKIISGKSHYNNTHLWILADYLDISVDHFFPPKNNFEQYRKIRPAATRDSYKQFMDLVSGGIG
mgnify:CR=1 FL=1